MKIIRKLVTGLMILLVALGSSPLEVFANDTYNPPDQTKREWPTQHYNGDVATTLPPPPAPKDIVDLNQMFNYPELDYSGLPADRPGELNVIKSLKGYVPDNNSTPNGDSSVAVITRDAPWQAGVMWSKESNKINLAEPFHMISYVYLGSRGQGEKNADDHKRAGADGITFTIHNDKKNETILDDNDRKVRAGSVNNYGKDAYGALGNGLGVYGSNFSANTDSDYNNMAEMTQGVTNGIALEFDTFYNHNDTTQHSDNDLWQFMKKSGSYGPGDNGEGSPESNYGHIGINYLNELQNNNANKEKQFGYESGRVIKHNTMLAVGWDGEISKLLYEGGGIPGLHYQNGWQVSKQPSKPLADNMWHRLEVKWEPTNQTTGELTYRIYQQGHTGNRNISDIYDTSKDGTAVLEKTLTVDVGNVFGVSDINNTVYWGFSGSTGYYQNNQAVQMLQLPVKYYTAELSKVDQDGKPVSGARFKIEKKDENGKWIVQQFYNPDSETSDYVKTLETGSQEEGIEEEVYKGVLQSLGKIKLTQLTAGTYRWKEVAPPEGYQKNQEYYPNDTGFVVNYQNPTVTTKAENKKLYQLELTKKNSETQEAIDGVPFIISKTENDKQYYLKVNAETTGFEWTTTEDDAKQFETGKSYFVRNGEIVEEATEIVEEATEDGYIRIGYIENGVDLKWKEVSVPAGYDSSGTLTGYFEASTDGYVYSATQTNSPIYQVSLEKTASDTNDALPGAVFSLQKKVDQNWETVSQDGVSEFTTNSEGKITISNLKAGTYRWKEVKAPDGYQISQPDQNGFVVAYDSNLEIDTDTNNYIFNTTIVENAPKDFELTLEKLALASTFETPLQGVEFELYDGDDSAGEPDFSTLPLIATVETKADGKIVLNNEQIQADKTYYLVESQTVDGFIQLEGYFTITTSKVDGINVTYVKADTETDESPFEFTKKDDDIYSGHLKIYNKPKVILPATGGNGILGYVGIGLTMIIVALLFFIARKRNLNG